MNKMGGTLLPSLRLFPGSHMFEMHVLPAHYFHFSMYEFFFECLLDPSFFGLPLLDCNQLDYGHLSINEAIAEIAGPIRISDHFLIILCSKIGLYRLIMFKV